MAGKAMEHPAPRQFLQPMMDMMVQRLGGDPDNLILLFMRDMPLRKFVAMGALDETTVTSIEEAGVAPS